MEEAAEQNQTFREAREKTQDELSRKIEELEESEKRFRNIFENAADGILIADMGSKSFSDCNQTICQMLGYTREEMLALGLSDIHPAKDLPHVMEQFQRQARGEFALAKELPVKRKDGSVFHADINSVPITLRGKPSLLGLFRDVTERMRAQEKLKLYSAELERANEEVKQFAYIVSHDLRAPLINLKGFASEIRLSLNTLAPALDAPLSCLSEEQGKAAAAARTDIPEALDFMDSSLTRMNDLINALLNLSRLGRRQLHLETLDMVETVRATLKGLAHQMEERDAKATVGPLPDAMADRTAMEQIMSNLLSNAINYLDPNRAGKIEISGEHKAEETVFFVRDNGCGIAKEDIPKVFMPFRRIGKQDIPGEGMGMAYVQALVYRHGGRIRCESEPGVGTTFSFSLPNSIEQGGHDADAEAR